MMTKKVKLYSSGFMHMLVYHKKVKSIDSSISIIVMEIWYEGLDIAQYSLLYQYSRWLNKKNQVLLLSFMLCTNDGDDIFVWAL